MQIDFHCAIADEKRFDQKFPSMPSWLNWSKMQPYQLSCGKRKKEIKSHAVHESVSFFCTIGSNLLWIRIWFLISNFSMINFQRFLYKLKSMNCDFEIIFLSSVVFITFEQPILNLTSFFMNFLSFFIKNFHQII